jgi:tight adherence protein B
MTGTLLGLLLGVGLLLVWLPPNSGSGTGPTRLNAWLAEAGLIAITPPRLVASCIGTGAVAALLMTGVSRSPVLGLAFGLLAATAPLALVNLRRRRRVEELREAWPDAVDNLASAVRAGLSLPEALIQLGERGPAPLRLAFVDFGRDYQATGALNVSLDRLRDRLADPVGDRVVASIRLAREVGGTDLGLLLRTLSTFLREDLRTRSELQSRQSWTVNAARLAVAAPWVLLVLLSLRPEAVRAYNSAAGVMVLLVGATLCVVAYRLMVRLGRLPAERRVLR